MADLTTDTYTANFTEDTLNVKITELISLGDQGQGDMKRTIYDPTNVYNDAFNMDNMAEGANTKILTQSERDIISKVKFWDVIHANSDINPALPYIYYKIDATNGPITVYLPDPTIGCIDEYSFELSIDTHKVTITTVSGIANAVNGNTSLILPRVGGKLNIKCDGLLGYDVTSDTRNMGSVVEIHGDRDFTTDGFEHDIIYKITPLVEGGSSLITLPPPNIFDDGRYIESTFALIGDGSFTVVRNDEGFVGGQLQQTISTVGASITIVEGEGEYTLSQDSRPKAANSIVEIPAYRLDEISDLGGIYYSLAPSKTDARYGAEVAKLSGLVTDATVNNPTNYVSYVSTLGYILGSFPASKATFYVTTKKVALAENPIQERNVIAHYKLYKRDEFGVETFIVKTSEFLVTSNQYSQFQISVETPEIVFAPTDRLVIKVFLQKSALAGINPELSTLIEGDNGAYIAFSQPTSSLRHGQLNGRYDEAQHPSSSISFDNTGTAFVSETAQDAIEEASGLQADGVRKFGDIDGGNYTEFGINGMQKFVGTSQVWDDLRASLIGKRLSTVQGTVAYNYEENSITFQPNGSISNIDDCVIFNFQIPHNAKQDTPLKLHIHYEKTSAVVSTFTVWYRIQKNGFPKTTAWTQIIKSTDTGDLFPYTSGTLNQICSIATIDTIGSGLSSQVHVRLTRTDGNVGDINATFIDAHYEIDSSGSSQEYVK